MKTNILETFFKMAKLKIRMKKLEKEYKDLEADAVNNHFEKVINKLGTFSPIPQKIYIMDNCAIAKRMGMAEFKKQSKISKTGIEKGIGSKGFEKLLQEGAIEHSDTSYYFRFTVKK